MGPALHEAPEKPTRCSVEVVSPSPLTIEILGPIFSTMNSTPNADIHTGATLTIISDKARTIRCATSYAFAKAEAFITRDRVCTAYIRHAHAGANFTEVSWNHRTNEIRRRSIPAAEYEAAIDLPAGSIIAELILAKAAEAERLAEIQRTRAGF